MVTVSQQVFGLSCEMISQVRNLLDYSESTKRRLFVDCQCASNNYISRNHTFFLMYVLLEPSSFSISLAKSRDISSDAMFANVHNARPTAYIFE
jgi:hypothetical protein